MCYNILEQRIQPEPFAWLCILTKYNATHGSLLNSADAEAGAIAFFRNVF
jgi:hypothetical protein